MHEVPEGDVGAAQEVADGRPASGEVVSNVDLKHVAPQSLQEELLQEKVTKNV